MPKPTKNNKYCLDTTCQYEKIKGEIKWIDKLCSEGNSVRSLYYVLFEYKKGLILGWIQFYFMVEVEGAVKAHFTWSNRYGRSAGNLNILDGMLYEQFEKSGFPMTKEDHLLAIETAIHRAMVIFDYKSDGEIGEFSTHPVVRHELFSAEDYRSFHSLLSSKSKDKFIPLSEFVTTHEETLRTINAGIKGDPKRKPLSDALEQVLGNSSNANKHNNSLALSDVVISCDTPPSFTLISKDSLHKEISDITGFKLMEYDNLVPKSKGV